MVITMVTMLAGLVTGYKNRFYQVNYFIYSENLFIINTFPLEEAAWCTETQRLKNFHTFSG